MAVPNSIPINIYVASGSTTSFSYTFRILSRDDLYVYVNNVLIDIGSYDVTGINAHVGGLVIFNSPPPVNAIVRVQRDVSLERTTDYVEGGALPAETLDNDFDKLTMQVQDLSRDAFKANHEGQYDAKLISIINVPTPINPNDATNKQYVDSQFSGSLSQIDSYLQQAQQAASNSANSASDSESFKHQAEEVFEQFSSVYYGALSIAPTQTPSGDPLPVGAAYLDLTTNQQKIWNGSNWVTAYTADVDLGSLGIPNHDKILVDNSGNVTFTGTATGLSKASVDLGNVDNTADLNKPVSGPQQTALNAKGNLAGGNTWAKSQLAVVENIATGGTITSITLNLASESDFVITLNNNLTLVNPTTPTGAAALTGTIKFIQDSVGGRTVAWGSNWKAANGQLPILSTSPNAIDLIVFYIDAQTTNVIVQLIKDVK